MDWNETVEELGPKLYRYFCGSFPAHHSEDLVQEVLVRLFRKISEGGYDPAKGTVRMLCFGIAHRVRLESLKGMRRQGNLFLRLLTRELETPSVQAAPDQGDDRGTKFRRLLEQLKEVERQIILLHVDEEFALPEIAQLLDLPLGTVKSHLHRAKAKLKATLKKDLGDPK